jgi:Integrase zinc binding domain
VLPEALVLPLTHSMHMSPISGAHSPPARVIQTIEKNYYRPKLHHMVHDIVKRCRPCQLSYSSARPRAPMAIHRAVSYPRCVVSMDLAVSLPVTHPEGYRHILIMVCNFTRFVMCAPLKDRSGESVLKAFRNTWLASIGVPMYIVCDNELSLTAGKFREFADTFNIKILNSLPWNPTGNSLAETSVKLCKQALRSFCLATSTGHQWDKHLWLISNCCNSLVSKSTNNSPDLLMYGFTPLNLMQNPVALLKASERPNSTVPTDVSRAAIVAMIENVCNVRDKQRMRNLRDKNAHKMPSPLHLGDVVLQKRMSKQIAQGIPMALTTKYKGPYVITDIHNKMASIRHCITGKRSLSSVDFLKPYFENKYDYSLPPAWDAEILAFQSKEENKINKTSPAPTRRSERIASKKLYPP